jgi:hypothetical protein
MTRSSVVTRVVFTLILAVSAERVQAQACDGRTEQRLDQESYLSLTDRVYVHAPVIENSGTANGWRPFELRILVGTYRPPLLLPRGVLKPGDLQKLLTTRPDIKVSGLPIPGYDPRGGGSPAVNAALTVGDGERPRKITVRAARVVPVSGGTSHMFLVCTPAG